MSKRTNELYTVTVVRYAHMVVEADSPKEAMKIADKYKDDYIDDEDFEDSENDVLMADADPSDIDYFCLEDDENVFTRDGVMTCEDYNEQLE